MLLPKIFKSEESISLEKEKMEEKKEEEKEKRKTSYADTTEILKNLDNPTVEDRASLIKRLEACPQLSPDGRG